ncbi:hemolysin family protein [Tumebacillus sp. BK434]|uniref:hemolysin family protein n=1 Tax=Tumebacillus sp. BK434 TaxID=2512169 RepID=UPI0024370715|nr:hemolysin family protein [Tumebacillus sp. BK434]
MDSTVLDTTFNLFLVVFLVFLNGFFVAAEFAMVKIRESRIQQLVMEGNKRALVAQKLVSNLDAYLSACQLGITLASLGLGWIGEPAIAHLIEGPLSQIGVPAIAIHTVAFIIAFAIITFLHIVLGELAPKSIAIQKSEGTVLNIATPLIWFHKIMYPFIWVLNGTANWLLKLIGLEPASEAEAAHTEDEIRILVSQSHRSGLIDQTEKVLFENVFDFASRIARDIMVPRIDIVAVSVDDTLEEILAKVEEEQLTRYPVIDGDKDNIIGFLNLKDLFIKFKRGEQFELRRMLRKVTFISESTEISSVMKQMQKNRSQLAIVVDEYGGTAGMITMEDIIEELVGEIQDEYDNEQPPIVYLPEQGYSVEGRLILEEVQDLLGTKIEHEEVDTLSGLIYTLLGKEPKVGDTVQYEGFEFKIEKMESHRIVRVKICPIQEATS